MNTLTSLVTFFLYVCATSASLYEVFAPCCHEGVSWSSISYRCDNYLGPVANISDSDQAACLAIIEVCCIKQTQINTCDEGKKTALDNLVCAIRDADPGAEQFRECCHCCRLGLESRLAEPACESPGLGEPCDTKYRECCKGEATVPANFTGGGGIVKRHSGSDIADTAKTDTVKTDQKNDTNNPTTVKTDQKNDTKNSTVNLMSTMVRVVNKSKETETGDNDVKTDDASDDVYQDLDECNLFPGRICSHICVNTRFGFFCACPQGFLLDPRDNRTCVAEGYGDEDDFDDDFVDSFGEQPTESDRRPTESDRRPIESDRWPTESDRRPIETDRWSTERDRNEKDARKDRGESENVSRTLSCRSGHNCQHRCIDRLQGGIECRCYDGYRIQRDGRSCKDIDECAERLARCAPGQQCVNTKGRFTCLTTRCLPGYEVNLLTGRCQYASGQRCQSGFAFNSVTGTCDDLNECGLGTDSCGTGERCENTIGSYRCRRVRHCGTGYTLDESTQQCIDNDECKLGTHNCAGAYQCQNIQGSFRCVPKICDAGFRFDRVKGECVPVNCKIGMAADSSGVCKDINECVDFGRTACRRHQRCINTKGSFYCRNTINCPAGYEIGPKSVCQDIDECSKGTNRCGPGQQCINRQGSYFCQCPRGMRHDDVRGCVDVDECSYGAAICPSNSKCVNTVGSFKCDCVDGLMADGNDACTDIDECSHEGICQQSCVNVLGTFFCSCHRGYQLRDDKRSCEDIDECTQFGGRRGRSGVCGGTCVNLPGSYRCECPEGWRLKTNGRSCDDVNECKEGIAYCPHPESLCVNTRGGYKCPVVTCPDGFLRTNSSSQQNSVRCKRISVDCEECRKGLIFRSFNFLSFPPKVKIPTPLFSMTGSQLVDKYYTWDLDLVSARPLRSGVLPAKEAYFALEKSINFVRVTLVRQIEGPQDVVLKVTMNTTSYFKGFESKSESQIYLFVTEEEYT